MENKNKPWAIQKELQKNEIASYGDVKVIASNISNVRTRALFILLYLTAGRISELCMELRKKDLNMVYKKGRDVLLIRIVNRKNKKRKWKTIPIPIDKEETLLKLLNEYLRDLNENDVLFNFGKVRAYQLLMKETGFNNHWIRHIRLSHLVIYHDFNDQLLTRFAGWTDSRPAKHYIELRWTDILDKY